MELNRVSIRNFKRVRDIALELGDINYLVGGNNSGKTSVLQAIHSAITAAQSQFENGGAQVIAEEQLRYSPTGEFYLLGHRGPFENRRGGRRATVTFEGQSDTGADASYTIALYKGRNNKNVGVERSGIAAGFGSRISQLRPPFSVYVPGLAGVPHFEEFRNEAFILRKVAGGEANLYLRNVLLMLRNSDRYGEFSEFLRRLFPDFDLAIAFEGGSDLYIDATVRTERGAYRVPIDMVGTGVLQALQIFAYAVLFRPALLLLDEPDAHLHPSNQSLLTQAFELLVERTDTKIILATHSRHLINSAPDDARFFWLENGTLKNDAEIESIKLLMDLGALDSADRILNSQSEFIFVSEDTDFKALKTLLRTVGEEPDRFEFITVAGVGNAALGASILNQLTPYIAGNRQIIMHRDRDFMTDQEVEMWMQDIRRYDVEPFVTCGPDIEAYFLGDVHLSAISGLPIEDVRAFVDNILAEEQDTIRSKFRKARQDINLKMHRDGGGPATDDLWNEFDWPTVSAVTGKFLVKKIRGLSRERLQQYFDPIAVSEGPLAPDLMAILDRLRLRA